MSSDPRTALRESAALAEQPSAHPRERPLPGTRLWFVLFLLWMGGLTFFALRMFERYEAGDTAAMPLWLLALMCFYLSLCNVFVPLPTTWIILLAASLEVGLFQSLTLRIVAVAGLGALATTMANLNEYHLLSCVFRYGLGRRLRRTRVYRWAIRWFDVAPFLTLALIGFLPIPIDAIRWLAILRQYARARFALAYFVGRGSRYGVFAGFSVALHLSGWQIAGIQAAIVTAAALGRLLGPRILRRRRR